MAGKGNGELVQSFYANFQAGDIEAVLTLLSPDFELVYSGPSVIPSAGTWKGHEGFRNWAQVALQGHLPPKSLNFEEFIVEGNKVVVPGHVALHVKHREDVRDGFPPLVYCARWQAHELA